MYSVRLGGKLSTLVLEVREIVTGTALYLCVPAPPGVFLPVLYPWRGAKAHTKAQGIRESGGGHSCLFVSSDGDAARECASINQSTEIVRYQEHLGGLLGGSPIPHSMHGNPSKCSLLIPFRIPDGIQYARRSLNRLIVGPLGRVVFHPCFLELLDIRNHPPSPRE